MSEVIKDEVPPKKRGPKPKYPYETWLDGRTHRLIPGEDFDCHPRTLDSAIRKAANLAGVRVSIYTEQDGSVIVFPANKTGEKPKGPSKSYGKKNNKNKKQEAKKEGSPQTSSNASKRKKVK